MGYQDTFAGLPQSQHIAKPRRKPTSTSNTSTPSGSFPPPKTVQMMLRTATEIGDVGHLVQPANRVPIRGSRPQSTRIRSGSFDSSLTPALRHRRYHRSRPEREYTNTQRQHIYGRPSFDGNSRSNFQHNHARRGPKITKDVHWREATRFKDRGAYSRSLRPYRSLMTLRAEEDTSSRASYSSSFSSASHRPLHPPLSHVSRSNNSSLRLEVATPTVAHLQSCKALGRDSVSALSYNSRLNSTMHFSRSFQQSPSINQSHVTTKVPTIGLSEHKNMNEEPAKGTKPMDDLHNGTALSGIVQRSALPRYYDYSESFLETHTPTDAESDSGDFSCNPAAHIYDTSGRSGHHNAGARLTDEFGSTSSPAELPANDDVLGSNNRNRNLAGNLNTGYGVSQRIISSQPAELPANDENLYKDCLQSLSPEVEPAILRPMTNRDRSRTLLDTHIFFSHGERSERNLAALAGRVHSPLVRHDSIMGNGNTPNRGQEKTMEAELQPGDAFSQDHSRNIAAHEIDGQPVLYTTAQLEVVSPRPEHPIVRPSQNLCSTVFTIPNISELDNTAIEQACEIPTASIGPELCHNVIIPDNCPIPADAKTINVLDRTRTPQRQTQLSNVNSGGKSTVDLLLEKHIESLGLLPDFETSSDDFEEVELVQRKAASCPETDRVISQDSHNVSMGNLQLNQSRTYRASSLTSEKRVNLKPRRLFASMDGRISAFPEPPVFLTVPNIWFAFNKCISPISCGWQILPSNSHTDLDRQSSRPTVTSGEMGDIDTDTQAIKHRVWNFSQFSLPTTLEDTASRMSSKISDFQVHKRSRSEIIRRQESQRRRQIKLRIRRQTSLHGDSVRPQVEQSSRQLPAISREDSQIKLLTQSCVELEGGRAVTDPKTTPIDAQQGTGLTNPQRWSKIMAAMPMPPTGLPAIPPKSISHVQRSMQTQPSQQSLAEPLNSTRQRSHIPKLDSKVPRLAPPDFGPPLDTSSLNLSLPYATIPSTIYPSLRETRSFFDDSPLRSRSLRKSIKHRFGLRPLRATAQGQRRASIAIKPDLPMRNGVPIPTVGSAPKGRTGRHPAHFGRETGIQNSPTSESMYVRRTIVEKFKGWWRRQCMQKAFAIKKDVGRNSTLTSVFH